MIVGHRLTPVGHDKVGIGFLRSPKGPGGVIIFEVVQVEYALDKLRLRRGGTRVRKVDLPE